MASLPPLQSEMNRLSELFQRALKRSTYCESLREKLEACNTQEQRFIEHPFGNQNCSLLARRQTKKYVASCLQVDSES